MATFTYNGSDERVFPTIATVVKPGESFEAPDDFSAADVTSTAAPKKAPAPAAIPADPSTSAASDPAVGA